ncbi:MAG: orotidine-5'-phosphate decarboxylase [Planctomycetota bacterium]|jgi:orotidine-5'-phosphate decarboxylase|nr:orotidine-5'-phosphate decarboxylase [Planctomycetota bacterium]
MSAGLIGWDRSFSDRMARAVREKQSVVVVGIDPVVESLPPDLARLAGEGTEGLFKALMDFCIGIIDSVFDLVPAIKPNIAFFEAYGVDGLMVYKLVCLAAERAGLMVIGDVKRGDIGSTATAYARALLDAPRLFTTGTVGVHASFSERVGSLLGPHAALTLNPYLGSDSILPFLERGLPRGQGFFILVKTSNPSAGEIQDLVLAEGGTLAERVASLVTEWGRDTISPESGLASVGAVVGATNPGELARYRALMPDAPFLLPGYGAQGAGAMDVVDAFRPDGSGGLVAASRSILNAWKKVGSSDWREAARGEVVNMNNDLRDTLSQVGKWRL